MHPVIVMDGDFLDAESRAMDARHELDADESRIGLELHSIEHGAADEPEIAIDVADGLNLRNAIKSALEDDDPCPENATPLFWADTRDLCVSMCTLACVGTAEIRCSWTCQNRVVLGGMKFICECGQY